jgi:prolyl oligopeptidase
MVACILLGACRTADDRSMGGENRMDTPERVGAAPSQHSDPYAWLEGIDDPRALEWVRQQNERTRRELAQGPRFEQMYQQALEALGSGSRVPDLSFKGEFLYNLWRTPENPRGVYRRTTLDELRKPEPRWETVLDIDALSAREGKRWVFKSMSCLPPENTRCLVSLSPGGGDAVEVREFDAETLRFVEGGFFLPTAKTSVAWIDRDHLFVATDFGEGSLTDSGYARMVRMWTRGTPLASARTIYEGAPSSVSVSATVRRTSRGDIATVSEGLTTWTSRHFQLVDGALRPLLTPESAVLTGAFQGRLVFRLNQEWETGGRVIPSGSVILASPADLTMETPSVDVLIEPTSSEIVEGVSIMDETILVRTLENVQGRLYRFTPLPAGGWARELIAFPDSGALSVKATRDSTGDALVEFQTFLDPPTLFQVSPGSRTPSRVLAQEPTFDGSRFEAVQQWAVSADGTRIPYFVVAARGIALDGSHPLHIFSYGGFRNSLTPSYSGSYEEHYGAYGRLWLERGGIYVLANIRGGGEFGPQWHSSAIRANRHLVYEDFEAVAADVVRRGYTSPERLGIEGRSQGGLLTLGSMVRRPELFGAVISGVPLADMRRYHRMLAGASWMAEYGNPDIPEEWAWIHRYSPYQNFRADASYPPVFIYGSLRDDRVHPGHGRKSAARLLELGHQVWYYENTEGGHGGSVTDEQLAYRIALSFEHLWRNLD